MQKIEWAEKTDDRKSSIATGHEGPNCNRSHNAKSSCGQRSIGWAPLVCLAALITLPTLVRAQEIETIDLGENVKLELVSIPAGTFRQGSPAGEKNRADDELERDVTISQPYFLAKSPITRGQFARFVVATGYKTESEKGPSGGFGVENGELVQKGIYNWRNPGFAQTDDHPAVIITYDDALAFTKWLATKTRKNFQLPTEAEWEYAQRAGTTTPFYAGEANDAADRIGWHKGNSGGITHPVGLKEANAWGLVDMGGNVWEWCRDWYGPYNAGPATDPFESRSNLSDKPRRVLRGGSFLKDPKNLRSAARYRSTPGTRNADTGFRVMYRTTVNAPVAPANNANQQSAPATQQEQTGSAPTNQADNKNAGMAPTTQPPIAPAGPRQLPRNLQPTPSPAVGYGGPRWGLALVCPCALVLVGAFALAVFLIMWRGQKRSLSSDLPGGVQPDGPTGDRRKRTTGPRPPRIVKDGFWLEDPIYSPGSVVRYSCQVGHNPTSGEFTVGVGHQGHFVYTGGTPSNIQILEVRPGAGGGMTMQDPLDPMNPMNPLRGPIIMGTTRTTSSSPPPPPTRTTHRAAGHPPAY